MNKEVFETWLKHFKKHLKYPDLPAILILDGHGSHVKALEALKFTSANNISIICLPPHTTNWTKPQDKCFFKPLKTHFAHECRKFMRQNPGKGITRFSFGSLFTPTYNKTAVIHLAVESFRVTGIFPLNRNIFPDSVFSLTATTNRSLSDNVAVQLAEKPFADKVDTERPAVSTGGQDLLEIHSTDKDGPITDSRELTVAADHCDGSELCSYRPTSVQHGNDLPSVGELEDETTHEQTVSNVVPFSDSTYDKNCRPINTSECILPIPQKQFNEPANTAKRKSQATTSCVLTRKVHLASLANELHKQPKQNHPTRK